MPLRVCDEWLGRIECDLSFIQLSVLMRREVRIPYVGKARLEGDWLSVVPYCVGMTNLLTSFLSTTKTVIAAIKSWP
jgi:hypothetical protein